jgi:hypothetical protein
MHRKQCIGQLIIGTPTGSMLCLVKYLIIKYIRIFQICVLYVFLYVHSAICVFCAIIDPRILHHRRMRPTTLYTPETFSFKISKSGYSGLNDTQRKLSPAS